MEQVDRELSINTAAWNNLAYVVLKRNGDLQRALTAATAAVKPAANHLHFRETRRQIFVKLGRWQEAIAHLEFALNGLPNAAGVYAALAKAYDSTGNSEFASIHARYSQESFAPRCDASPRADGGVLELGRRAVLDFRLRLTAASSIAFAIALLNGVVRAPLGKD